ncbi:MAG: hypothetical protein ABSG25_14665 [Bryobacteraceae bacterium]|jgi:hypothetical protein
MPKPKNVSCLRLAAGLAWLALGWIAGPGALAGEKAPQAKPQGDGLTRALVTGCQWRRHYTFFPPEVSEAGAKELGVDPKDLAARRKALKYAFVWYSSDHETIFPALETDPPPAGWHHAPNCLWLTFSRYGYMPVYLWGRPNVWSFRIVMDCALVTGSCGYTRVGGDFFPVIGDIGKYWKSLGVQMSGESAGGCGGTLFGSFPPSTAGQLGIGYGAFDLFGPGPDGPVRTVRFENLFLGNQESEARIVVEKAIAGKKLPAELAEKCQALLDRRTNALRMWLVNPPRTPESIPLGSQGWESCAQELFECAGKAAK